jgi:uncharacterized protein YcaQ
MTTPPAPALELSSDEARRAALFAQGLLGAPDRRSGAAGVVHRLGAVQLDTISVLARSHELVPYARLGAIGRPAVERAYWNHEPHRATTFEYWAHAACVLPVELWPVFGWRRRSYRERGLGAWYTAVPDAVAAVHHRLIEDGPLTATELGGAKKGGEWWDWSDTKIAVELLLAGGEVVCVERRGWKRVYDLPERALPKDVLDASEPDQDEAYRVLLARAGRALGVGTATDLADYYRLRMPDAARALPDTDLVPVTVAGWRQPAWADPAALAIVAAGGPRGRHRTTLLSPFDSLVWERKRTERIFGFSHRLEAYVPREKREHGYFAMPLLAGGRLVGRVDPAREGRTLIARQVSLDGPKYVEAAALALREAAGWVGCDAVRVERVAADGLADALRVALA